MRVSVTSRSRAAGVPSGEGVRLPGVSLSSCLREEEGQGLVEYGLVITVIAISVIVALVFVQGQLQDMFSDIGNSLP